MALFLKVLGLAAAAFIVDRLLLGMEAWGWINYRRNGLSLGAARYHVLETHAVFEPGAETLQEALYEEEVSDDESGDPPTGGPDDGDEGSGTLS